MAGKQKYNREKMIKLREQGYTYEQLRKYFGCSMHTVLYNLRADFREKESKRSKKKYAKEVNTHPYIRKIKGFKRSIVYNKRIKVTTAAQKRLYNKVSAFQLGDNMKHFTFQDVLDKFGENPKCYLTGKPIDIWKPSTYHFDHIVSRAKGGDSTIDNLGICTKEANVAKNNMTKEEFIQLCKDVVEYNTIK